MHCAGLDYFVDVHVGVGDERWALPVGSRALETPRLVSQCGRDKLDGSMDAERTVSSCSINVLQIACLAAAFF